MIALTELFPCLGLQALGMCTYDPSHPAQVYFSIGDAIAALGFTLAIQQLLKPIYLFRLRAYGLKIVHLSFAVFLGASCSVAAAVLPNMPIVHDSPLEYAIVWEVAGWLLIAGAYGVAAFISLTPAQVNDFTLRPFIQAASTLLSSASDDDRVTFAGDLLHGRNIERLIGYADAWELAERHAATIEFERLREIGAPLTIIGRAPISAFYLFSHRKELDAASFAGTFLHILSDSQFCSALVRHRAWPTSQLLTTLAEKRLFTDQAQPFIQEIASQAILSEESMIAKEVSFTGFRTVPVLINSLFGNWFILHHYNPLSRLSLSMPDNPSESFVIRLNGASEMMLETAIRGENYWGAGFLYSVESAYEQLSRNWGFARDKSERIAFGTYLHIGIADLYKVTLEGLSHLAWHRKKSLFVTDKKKHHSDLVEVVASIIYESLAGIANKFTGFGDEAWHHAIRVFMDIYPFHSDAPAGMNPLQQQLALKLIDKLKDNMDGYYPAITRVLLAAIGPYESDSKILERSAHVILKDAVYKELQNLTKLHARSPEKIAAYLPANVVYESATNTLTHSYREGASRVTNLSALTLPDVDFTDEANWQKA